jgi:hypothetical protein
MSITASRAPIWMSLCVRYTPYAPIWYSPTSKVTRVRSDGFSKISATAVGRSKRNNSRPPCVARFIACASARTVSADSRVRSVIDR